MMKIVCMSLWFAVSLVDPAYAPTDGKEICALMDHIDPLTAEGFPYLLKLCGWKI
jgi:hypothetical protein